MPVPFTTPPTRISTVALASAVPLKVGVVSPVMLSVLDAPVSDAVSRSGTVGAAGPLVSIVTDSAADCALTLLPLLARAVMLLTPVVSTDVVIVHAPLISAVAEPTTVPLASSSTISPALAVPVNVGVLTLVMLSVLEAPLSEAVVRAGALGVGTGG